MKLGGSINIYKQLNQLIEYIENNLENRIDYKKLSQILCTNPYVMQRLFYLMTNITVTEYIKKRRLSKAVLEIINGKKILDIAILYQYGSSEAFSRAFKAMHGINPSVLKKEDIKLKLTPILKFNEDNNPDMNIKYRIVKNKAFKLFSINFKSTDKNVSKYTDAFWKNEKEKSPELLISEKRYGIVEYKKNHEVNYHIGLESSFRNSKALAIPKTNWIVIELNSFNASDIDRKSNLVYNDYSKSLGYIINPSFDVEIYYQDYLELWFPINN